jgi:hypothetical protein
MDIFLQDARVSFVNGLFTASAMEEGQTKKFGADFLIDDQTKVFEIKPDPKNPGKNIHVPTTMPAAMLAAANQTWKGKGKEMLESLERSKKCFRDGNKRINKNGEQYPDYVGLTYVTAKNKVQPGLFDIDGMTRIKEASGRLYSGCRVNVSFTITGQPDTTRKGVHASLTGVQFVRNDKPFSGGTPVGEGYFAALDSGADASSIL